MTRTILTINTRSVARLSALVLCVSALSGRDSAAAENVPTLVDEGISQILVDEVAERMARFMTPYEINGVQSLSVSGAFRTLSSDALEQQLIRTFEQRGILVDGSAPMKLAGSLISVQTDDSLILMMRCTLIEAGGVEVCTVQVRKVLPVKSGS